MPLFTGQLPSWASSGDRWAPEALEVNETLNAMVFCDKEPSGEHRIGWVLAEGTQRLPESWSRYAPGPLELGGAKGGDIDPHLFRDVDGATYLLWKTVWGSEIPSSPKQSGRLAS
ncbi:NLRC3, partial [Symbiodinium pilosum]